MASWLSGGKSLKKKKPKTLGSVFRLGASSKYACQCVWFRSIAQPP